jgi:hypothetical protein
MDEERRRLIQMAIIDRLDAMSHNCNEGHLFHNEGVLRGLLWALNGEDPGTHLTTKSDWAIEDVLKLAGIHTRRQDGRVIWWYPWEQEPTYEEAAQFKG